MAFSPNPGDMLEPAEAPFEVDPRFGGQEQPVGSGVAGTGLSWPMLGLGAGASALALYALHNHLTEKRRREQEVELPELQKLGVFWVYALAKQADGPFGRGPFGTGVPNMGQPVPGAPPPPSFAEAAGNAISQTGRGLYDIGTGLYDQTMGRLGRFTRGSGYAVAGGVGSGVADVMHGLSSAPEDRAYWGQFGDKMRQGQALGQADFWNLGDPRSAVGAHVQMEDARLRGEGAPGTAAMMNAGDFASSKLVPVIATGGAAIGGLRGAAPVVGSVGQAARGAATGAATTGAIAAGPSLLRRGWEYARPIAEMAGFAAAPRVIEKATGTGEYGPDERAARALQQLGGPELARQYAGAPNLAARDRILSSLVEDLLPARSQALGMSPARMQNLIGADGHISPAEIEALQAATSPEEFQVMLKAQPGLVEPPDEIEATFAQRHGQPPRRPPTPPAPQTAPQGPQGAQASPANPGSMAINQPPVVPTPGTKPEQPAAAQPQQPAAPPAAPAAPQAAPQGPQGAGVPGADQQQQQQADFLTQYGPAMGLSLPVIAALLMSGSGGASILPLLLLALGGGALYAGHQANQGLPQVPAGEEGQLKLLQRALVDPKAMNALFNAQSAGGGAGLPAAGLGILRGLSRVIPGIEKLPFGGKTPQQYMLDQAAQKAHDATGVAPDTFKQKMMFEALKSLGKKFDLPH